MKTQKQSQGYLTVAIGGHLFLRRKRELACISCSNGTFACKAVHPPKCSLHKKSTRRVLQHPVVEADTHK